MIRFLENIIAGRGEGYKALFLKNEFRSLVGPRQKNLRTLFRFTLLAFFAVTFAQAGLRYLEMRMDNPFINWLTFPVSADIDSRYSDIVSDLNEYRDDDLYSLDNVNGFMRYAMYFRNSEGKELKDRVKGRTYSFPEDTVLIQKILSGENLRSLSAAGASPMNWSEEERKKGVILTADLLEQIGCEDPEYIYGRYLSFFPKLKVIGVVQSLPDRALFMTSYEMYWGLVKGVGSEASIYQFSESEQIDFLIHEDEDYQFDENDRSRLAQLVKDASSIDLLDVEQDLVDEDCSYNSKLRLKLSESPGEYGYERICSEVTEALDHLHPFVLEDYSYHRLGDLTSNTDIEFSPGSDRNPYSSITLHFSSIDSIRAFRNYLLTYKEIDISLEQVESRENFNLVSILTSILALALALFTLVSITLYISNVLQSHLEKIKTNLGTFMAFGLSKEFLVKSYTRLTLGMLTMVSVLVLVILVLLDLADVPYRVLRLFGKNIKTDFNEAFSVFSSWLAILIFFILVLAWWRCRKLIREILRHYPSDLIYNRTD